MPRDNERKEWIKRDSPVILSENSCQRLLDFANLIFEYRKPARLTAYKSKDEILDYLIIESLQLARLLPSAGQVSVVDLGAGSGAVGISLAIALPNLSVCLIDRSLRKIGFLRIALSSLRLENVSILEKDVSNKKTQNNPNYDFVVSRGFSPIGKLLPISRKFLRPGGQVLGFTRSQSPSSIASSISEEGCALNIFEKYRLSSGREGAVYSILLK